MSGYVPAKSPFVGQVDGPLLRKPFSPSEMLDQLRELLDESPAEDRDR